MGDQRARTPAAARATVDDAGDRIGCRLIICTECALHCPVRHVVYQRGQPVTAEGTHGRTAEL
jgi:hypothetical protein